MIPDMSPHEMLKMIQSMPDDKTAEILKNLPPQLMQKIMAQTTGNAAPQQAAPPQPTVSPLPTPAAQPMGVAPNPDAAPTNPMAAMPPPGAQAMGAAPKPPMPPDPQMPTGGQPQPQANPMGTFKRGGHVTTKVHAAVRSKKAPRW